MVNKKIIDKSPHSPGVYIFRSKDGKPVYVGKAADIRKRLRSHFSGKDKDPKHGILISKVSDISFITTKSEVEALLLEANLIKSLKPKYNVEMKDDKSFPYLKLTLKEKYPRLALTRKLRRDGSKYYGPYTNVKLLRTALDFMQKAFPLRKCSVMPKKVCLDYHLGHCLGPCSGKISEKKYMTVIRDLMLFMEGKKDKLIERLSKRMRAAASKKRYEEAAIIRDQIRALSTVSKTKRLKADIKDVLAEMKEIFSLKNPPKRIEGFDISNIRGKEAVGSMVTFYNGKPEKEMYRRFKIREIPGIDDYGMLKEVLRRRYAKATDERLKMPDLTVIDGGLGHLNAAREQLSAIGVGVPAIAIAKEREHIFTSRGNTPLILPRSSRTLQLVQRIRDEAHRFAVNYHKILRKKYMLASRLDGISGIGDIRKKRILRYVSSLDSVKDANAKDLAAAAGILYEKAKEITGLIKG
jgi:excinuclease ABC subunit C